MDRCNNEFRCTEHQLLEFTTSPLWQDLLQEIQNWKNRILEDLANPSFDANTGKMVLQKTDRVLYDEMLRGNFQALTQVERLPEVIAEIVGQNKEGAK